MVCELMNVSLFHRPCAGASRKVHHASLHRLVGAPISFFDTTPVGRVLNRFSKDTDDMDYQLCVFIWAAPAACIPMLMVLSVPPTSSQHTACSHCEHHAGRP